MSWHAGALLRKRLSWRILTWCFSPWMKLLTKGAIQGSNNTRSGHIWIVHMCDEGIPELYNRLSFPWHSSRSLGIEIVWLYYAACIQLIPLICVRKVRKVSDGNCIEWARYATGRTTLVINESTSMSGALPSSEFIFEIKFNIVGILWSCKYYYLIIVIHSFFRWPTRHVCLNSITAPDSSSGCVQDYLGDGCRDNCFESDDAWRWTNWCASRWTGVDSNCIEWTVSFLVLTNVGFFTWYGLRIC